MQSMPTNKGGLPLTDDDDTPGLRNCLVFGVTNGLNRGNRRRSMGAEMVTDLLYAPVEVFACPL